MGRLASEARLCGPTLVAESFWSKLPQETGQYLVKIELPGGDLESRVCVFVCGGWRSTSGPPGAVPPFCFLLTFIWGWGSRVAVCMWGLEDRFGEMLLTCGSWGANSVWFGGELVYPPSHPVGPELA